MKSIIFTFAFLIGIALAAQAQKQLPAFSFTDLQGEVFTQDNLNADKASIFMFFDPWCDHCAQQADWIAASQKDFKDVQIFFVTTEPDASATKEFKQKHFGDADLPNLHFLLDTEFMFDGYFDGYYEVPSILIYNAEGMRTKILNKESSAETLLKYI